MKIMSKVRIIFPIMILSVFLYSANIEYKREVSDQRQVLLSQLQILTAQVNQFVNQSIRNTTGVISYVQTNWDLTQDELNKFSVNLLPVDNKIISHFSILKDTTIILAYPLEGNESTIGLDLTTIESQRDVVLQVKNKGRSVFVGPVDLVQGGSMLINRVPIFLHPNTSEQAYFGQLALVINYEPMLDEAGIIEFSKKYHIHIQQQMDDGSFNQIYSNTDVYSEFAMAVVINVSNSKWKITAEPKAGYNGKTSIFYMLIFSGIAFSSIIGYAINRLYLSNEALNNLVDKRTNGIKLINDSLVESIEELKVTQEKLIMREKLAALGELVAGVAHEINTPLGVCVTVNSFLKDKTLHIDNDLKSNKLKKSDLVDGVSKILESAEILEFNLDRAAKLVSSFKQLAADQSYEEKRVINLNDYLRHILKIISPALRKSSSSIIFDIDDDINIETYPGALSQVFTNLTMNSLIHGFKGIDNGVITICGYRDVDTIVLDYFDNGIGILEEYKEKIFDPFFTTNRENGGTGLGMHIAYNIINQKLGGTIELLGIECGVHFRIVLPK